MIPIEGVGDVRSVIADVLSISAEDVAAGCDLRTLPGMDSVKILRIITRIEQTHGIELEDDVVFRAVTLDDLEGLVRSRIGAGVA